MPHGIAPFFPLRTSSPTVGRLTRAANRLIGGYRYFNAPALPSDTDVALAWDEYDGLPLATRTNIPVVSGMIWASDASSSEFQRALLRRALGRVAGLFVLSRAQIPVLVNDFGMEPRRVEFVPFGVDTTFFSREQVEGEWRESRGCKPVILTVGRDRHRDWATFDAALGILRSRGVRFDAVAAVRGKAPRLRNAECKSLDHAELRAAYATSTVTVVPTTHNLHGSGMTAALESMSMGCPVVATQTPGLEDYISDGQTGYMVPPSDPVSLADQIYVVLNSDSAALVARALAAVRSDHSVETQGLRIASLIKRVAL